MKDFRSDLQDWQDMWDAAQEEGVHPSPELLKTQPSADFDNTPQDTYYNCLDSEELLQEAKIPNPIYPDSVGPDHEDPKPVWVSEDLLKEVESLKNKLFDLENRMAKMGGDDTVTEKPIETENKKMMDELNSLKEKIEKVSSQLGIKHEPSPWHIKD